MLLDMGHGAFRVTEDLPMVVVYVHVDGTAWMLVVSRAAPPNLRERGGCLVTTCTASCSSGMQKYGQPQTIRGRLYVRTLQANRCYAINSNLERNWTRSNPVARTTSCIHGHQTLFLLRLKTRMFVCSLAGQPLYKREEGADPPD